MARVTINAPPGAYEKAIENCTGLYFKDEKHRDAWIMATQAVAWRDGRNAAADHLASLGMSWLADQVRVLKSPYEDASHAA